MRTDRGVREMLLLTINCCPATAIASVFNPSGDNCSLQPSSRLHSLQDCLQESSTTRNSRNPREVELGVVIAVVQTGARQW